MGWGLSQVSDKARVQWPVLQSGARNMQQSAAPAAPTYNVLSLSPASSSLLLQLGNKSCLMTTIFLSLCWPLVNTEEKHDLELPNAAVTAVLQMYECCG